MNLEKLYETVSIRWILVLLSGAIIGSTVVSEVHGTQLFSRDPMKRDFNEGVRQYNEQNYQQALQTFQLLYSSSQFNPMQTATHLMMVKTYHRLGLNRRSVQFGKEFLDNYPNSGYVDDIYYSMAEAFVGLRQYTNGAIYYGYSITQTNDEALGRIALEHLLKVTDAFLETPEVEALLYGAIGRYESNIFQLALLQEYILNGEMSLASTTASELERSVMQDMLVPTFEALRKAISLDANRQSAIAVLAPLSGPYSDVGEEMLAGIRYALSNAEDLSNISIIPLDNTGTGLQTVKQIQRVVDHHRVVAIVGPVYSDNVVAGAAIAGQGQIPLITPTATENGLAGMNEYIFQLSPDYETRGKATAQYAADSLGLRLFATVSPTDRQGTALTDAFTAEIERRGGDVVAQLWYTDEPEDLTDQWEHLRDIGFQLREEFDGGIDTSLIVPDSIRATLSDSEFVQLFNEEYEDYVEQIDSSEITLRHIDGMYFPVRNNDIDYIAGQFAFFNFDSQVLGTVEWYDLDKLNEYSTYIDSMIIFSDYYLPENSRTYNNFVTQFRLDMGTSPTNLHFYGYDTMNMLLDILREGNTTRASITSALNAAHQVSGMARIHTLDGVKSRVNQSVQVLQYDRRRGLNLIDSMIIGPRQIHPLQSFFAE